MPGWRQPTSSCTTWRELPLAARRYIARLEELVNCPVAIVSTGKDRKQTIRVRPNALKWLKSS